MRFLPEGTRPLQLKPTGPRTDESGNPLSQEAYGANMMFKSQEDFDAGYQNYLSQFNQPQDQGKPLGGGIAQINSNPILQIMQTGSPTPKPAQPATQPGVLSGGFASPAPSLTLAGTAQESASSNTIMPTVEPIIENTASVEPISSTNEAISNPTETNNVGSNGIKGIVDNYIKNYIDNYFKNNFK